MNGNSAWRFQLAPELSSCRLLNGMWRVSGAHGRIDPTAAGRSMFDYGDAGFITWDLADLQRGGGRGGGFAGVDWGLWG